MLFRSVRAICSAEEGEIFLKITQDKSEKVINITNFDGYIDMTDFHEGEIELETYNNQAKGVSIEILWKK